MRSKIYTRDGVNYEMLAAQRDGNHVATWKCLRCPGASGETSGKYADLDSAIDAAKARLFSEHHSRIHVAKFAPQKPARVR
jgi:hypothetical protein